MKKITVIFLALTICSLASCSCSTESSKNDTTSNPTTATLNDTQETNAHTITPTDIETSATETGKPVTEIETHQVTEPSVDETGLIITTEYYTVTMPENWKGKYEYQVIPENVAYSLRFYHKPSKDAGYGGHLFTIALYSPDDDYTTLPAYKIINTIITTNGQELDIVKLFPTDVQFDFDLAEEYSALAEDSSHILNGIQLTEKAKYK